MAFPILSLLPFVGSLILKIIDWIKGAEETHGPGTGGEKLKEVVQKAMDFLEAKLGFDIPDKWEPVIADLIVELIESLLTGMKEKGDIPN